MFQKVKQCLKEFAGSVEAKVGALGSVAVSMLSVGASASETTAVTASDWSSVTTAITTQVSVANVVAVLVAGTTVAIGFVFMWWGVRKVTRMIMSAWRKGRLSE